MTNPVLNETAPVPQSVNIPLVYVNGFVNNLGTSDVSLILLVDAVPTMKLNMSYTTAKTLSGLLSEAIKTLEKATGNTIMNSQEVETGLRKFMSENK
jgi:hypothetical protein